MDNQKAVVDAINRMFRKKDWFCICTVDKCMRVVGATATAEYDALCLYHCVPYSDMDADTKAWVYRVTLENISNVDSFPEIKLIEREHTTALSILGRARIVEQA